jgi:two-component system, chemotaxis family, chemotaxis protein CheY
MEELSSEMLRKHILMVDDVGSVRSLCKSFLRDIGFTNVHEANSGSTAILFMRHHPVDLLICDWNMPQMSGYQLLLLVRQDPHIAKLPFLMVTGMDDVSMVKAAISAGVSDYILKPFKPSQLGFKAVRTLESSKHDSASRMSLPHAEEASASEAPADAASALSGAAVPAIEPGATPAPLTSPVTDSGSLSAGDTEARAATPNASA